MLTKKEAKAMAHLIAAESIDALAEDSEAFGSHPRFEDLEPSAVEAVRAEILDLAGKLHTRGLYASCLRSPKD